MLEAPELGESVEISAVAVGAPKSFIAQKSANVPIGLIIARNAKAFALNKPEFGFSLFRMGFIHVEVSRLLIVFILWTHFAKLFSIC